MTVFVDTSVIMYAAGAEHDLQAPCREVLRRVAAGELSAVTSTEVVQEILHRFARGRRDVGGRMARHTMELFGELLPVEHVVMVDAVRRYEHAPEVSSRDAVHAATCLMNGLDQIVSTDAGFDAIPDVVRVAPSTLAESRPDR